MHLHRISKTVGYISYLRSESKVFVSRNGSFLEERFLSKELSGRVVELDEVIEPSLQPVCSRAQEVVPVAPTPIEVEADDGDHQASNQVTTNLVGRQGRVLLQSSTVTLSWRSCCLSNSEPTSYGESNGGPGFRQMAGGHEIRERIHV